MKKPWFAGPVKKRLIRKNKMEKKFEEHSCEFKNEAECEEELDDEGLSYEHEEAKEFGEI